MALSVENPFEGLSDVTALPGVAALGESERAFIGRMYSGDPARYVQRLRRIGFEGLGRVLDLGCGFGQWSLCLRALNESVVGVDIGEHRVAVVRDIAERLKLGGFDAHAGRGEAIPVESESIDALFCYGVFWLMDTARFFCEAARVCRPGARMYITGKDIGGFLYFHEKQPNAASDYDPRQVAADAFANTVFLKRYGRLFPGAENPDRIVSSDEAVKAAVDAGFEVLGVGPEGTVVSSSTEANNEATNTGTKTDSMLTGFYNGYPKAYELLLERKS